MRYLCESIFYDCLCYNLSHGGISLLVHVAGIQKELTSLTIVQFVDGGRCVDTFNFIFFRQITQGLIIAIVKQSHRVRLPRIFKPEGLVKDPHHERRHLVVPGHHTGRRNQYGLHALFHTAINSILHILNKGLRHKPT